MYFPADPYFFSPLLTELSKKNKTLAKHVEGAKTKQKQKFLPVPTYPIFLAMPPERDFLFCLKHTHIDTPTHTQ